jgi:hypothetical protein
VQWFDNEQRAFEYLTAAVARSVKARLKKEGVQ